jgi:hypothetical protein
MADLPPLTQSAVEVAATLAQGKWVVRPDEMSEVDGQSAEVWREGVTVVCKKHGVPLEFERFADEEMTVAVNSKQPPSGDQLLHSIHYMLKVREQQRESRPRQT